MPCSCWQEDGELESEMKTIRDHMREIVKEAHKMGEKQKASRDLLKDIHALLDHLYQGSCAETGKEVVC